MEVRGSGLAYHGDCRERAGRLLPMRGGYFGYRMCYDRAKCLRNILGAVRSGAGQGYLSYLSYLYIASTQADATLSTRN